ncbi:MAG: hypothetical protein EA377_01210 [Phycisphaerales bacterium]|nr:MAG: hypothetical protein EA377_01210 [Phycisphaerales bacterium]
MLAMLCVMGLSAGLGGCQQAPSVRLNATADPEHHFQSADRTLTALAVLRVDEDASPEQGYLVFDREELDLEERRALSEIRRGLERAGMPIVSFSEADTLLTVRLERLYGVEDTYRRVPVYESTHGWYDTDQGFRHFRGTRSTSVVVPERRPFEERIVILTAHRLDASARDRIHRTELPNAPAERTAYWKGVVSGRGTVVDDELDRNVRELIGLWGQTDRKTFVPSEAE